MKKFIFLILITVGVAACNPYGSEIPDKLIGNWMNQDNGYWEYGLFEEFAIFNKNFWKYVSVTDSEIVIEKDAPDNQQVTLNISLINDSTLAINGKQYRRAVIPVDLSDYRNKDLSIWIDLAAANYKLFTDYSNLEEDTTDFAPFSYNCMNSAVVLCYHRNTAQGISSFARRYRVSDWPIWGRFDEVFWINDSLWNYGRRYNFLWKFNGVASLDVSSTLQSWSIDLPYVLQSNDTILIYTNYETLPIEGYYRKEHYVMCSNQRLCQEQDAFCNWLFMQDRSAFSTLRNNMSDSAYYCQRLNDYQKDNYYLQTYIQQSKIPLSKKFVRYNTVLIKYRFAFDVCGIAEAEEALDTIKINENDFFVSMARMYAFKRVFLNDSRLYGNSDTCYLPVTKENIDNNPGFILCKDNKDHRRLVNPKVINDLGLSGEFADYFRFHEARNYLSGSMINNKYEAYNLKDYEIKYFEDYLSKENFNMLHIL